MQGSETDEISDQEPTRTPCGMVSDEGGAGQRPLARAANWTRSAALGSLRAGRPWVTCQRELARAPSTGHRRSSPRPEGESPTLGRVGAGVAPTYRGGEAAPQGLELPRADVLAQAAAGGRGGLHAPAVRCSLQGEGAVGGLTAAIAPPPPPARPFWPHRHGPALGSLPRPRRPPSAPGRRGGGSARAPTPLRLPT